MTILMTFAFYNILIKTLFNFGLSVNLSQSTSKVKHQVAKAIITVAITTVLF